MTLLTTTMTTTMIGMTIGNDLLSREESNFGLGVVDAICCFLGLLTVFLGVWIDGISLFFVGLFLLSAFMGVAGWIRLSRERDMSDNNVPEPWQTH